MLASLRANGEAAMLRQDSEKRPERAWDVVGDRTVGRHCDVNQGDPAGADETGGESEHP